MSAVSLLTHSSALQGEAEPGSLALSGSQHYIKTSKSFCELLSGPIYSASCLYCRRQGRTIYEVSETLNASHRISATMSTRLLMLLHFVTAF